MSQLLMIFNPKKKKKKKFDILRDRSQAWRKMGISVRVGFMAVFAISGSVVLLAHQVHKRLLSDFMKRVESELGTTHVLHSHAKKLKKVKSELGTISCTSMS